MHSSSGEKIEVIMRNTWLVKAGIPLLLSAAAFITAKILSSRPSPVSPVSEYEEIEELTGYSSLSSPAIEIKADVDEILEDLKRREYELERRFFIYQDMKERESMAMESRNKLCLEMTRIEFLAREASLMEAEARRMEELTVEYLEVVKKLQKSRRMKALVEKKARKLRKRVGEKSRVLREQSLSIKARDEEILRNQTELERKSEVIMELENEVRLINGVVDQLKEEKIELLNKLEMVERSASTAPVSNEEAVTKEEYDKVVEELEQTEKNKAAMENELIQLRWSNAGLRRELKRCQEQLERIQEDTTNKTNHLQLESSPNQPKTLQELFDEVECDGSPLVHDNEGSCVQFSRRKRFVKKLRKWVESGKMDEKQKHEEMIKCFGRHSGALFEEAYGNFVHPRNSFSSV